jgi:hypothetical protein
MAFDRHLNVIDDHNSDERAMKSMSRGASVSRRCRAALHKEKACISGAAQPRLAKICRACGDKRLIDLVEWKLPGSACDTFSDAGRNHSCAGRVHDGVSGIG